MMDKKYLVDFTKIDLDGDAGYSTRREMFSIVDTEEEASLEIFEKLKDIRDTMWGHEHVVNGISKPLDKLISDFEKGQLYAFLLWGNQEIIIEVHDIHFEGGIVEMTEEYYKMQ